jgi:hypothetical protein
MFQKSRFFMMNRLSPPTLAPALLAALPLPLLEVLERFFNDCDL